MKFLLTLRLLSLIVFGFIGLSAIFAQSPSNSGTLNPSPAPEVQNLRPDALISVTEDKSTAELVEITMVDANFSKKVLEQIVRNFGTLTGIEPRGVMIYSNNLSEGQAFLKAKFGINGLVEPAMGEIRLEQIAKAFVGLQDNKNQINNLQITFPSMIPSPSIVQFHSNAFCDVQGHLEKSPPELSYLVRLRTQDPSKISIPAKFTPEKPVEKKNEQKSSNNRPLMYMFVALGALAAGIIAFLLFAKGVPRA